MADEIKNPFEYQKPSENAVAKITEVREKCKELYALLQTMPGCRENSVSITKLEEVSMWANKAIAFHVE